MLSANAVSRCLCSCGLHECYVTASKWSSDIGLGSINLKAVALAVTYGRMCNASAACMRCRGVAKFERGMPLRMNSMRMLWGKGVRAGIYPLSDNEAYWFTTKNCSAVGTLLFMGQKQPVHLIV